MSELCRAALSERLSEQCADEDIARLKYVSVNVRRPFAVWEFDGGDLLFHIPIDTDFTCSWSIEMAPIGTVCTIVATVDRIVQSSLSAHAVTEVSLVDDGRASGCLFPSALIAQQLKQGDRLAVMGKVEFAYGFTDGLAAF
ncbi:MAG: hypothetical protein ACLRM9_06880 [Collinsella aerofaciens]